MSAQTAPWVAWCMLGLAVCAALADVLQPAVIRTGFAGLIAKAERSYTDAPINYMGQVLLFVFRCGVVAMAIALYEHDKGDFVIEAYGKILGAVMGIEIGKGIMSVVVNYTFELSRQFSSLFTHYSYVTTSICCLLYPVLLLIISLDMPSIQTIVLLSALTISAVLLFIKWIGVFFSGIGSIFYVAIYIFTAEVLPLIALTHLFS